MIKSKQLLKNNKPVIFALVIIGLLLGVLIWNLINSNTQQLVINNSSYDYMLADDGPERIQGLSGRESMPQDEALIFVFDSSAKHGIWMKDMNFAIDIVWLNEAKQVVSIKEGATPESYPETFMPNEPAKYVIELNAGQVKSADIQLGDTAEF